jgi:hypothetical protein
MTLPEIHPLTLQDTINDRLGGITPNVDDLLVVVDCASTAFQIAIFRYTAFCGFVPAGTQTLQQLNHAYNNNPDPTSRQHVVKTLLEQQLITTALRAKAPIAIFAVGDLTSDRDLLTAIQQAIYGIPVIDINPGSPHRLPHGSQLTQDLTRPPDVTPNRLTMLVAQLEGFEENATIVPTEHIIYEAWEGIDDHTRLGHEFEIIAPEINDDFILYFLETPAGSTYPTKASYYWVRAAKRVVTVRIAFDQQACDWKLLTRRGELELSPANAVEDQDWTGDRVFVSTHERPMPPNGIPVTVTDGNPNLVIAIDSTLGMHLAYRQQGGRASTDTDETDFQVVKKLCEQIVQSLFHILEMRFLLLFYGSHQPVPPELRKIGLPQRVGDENRVVTFLPRPVRNKPLKFVDANEILKEIQTNFDNQRTATQSWHRSVDEALHALNNDVPWDYADRIVVWIGGSPPFRYAEGEDIPADEKHDTMHSKYKFDNELKVLTEQHRAHNIAIFVTGDIPTNRQDLRDIATDAWYDIVQGDEARLFQRVLRDEVDTLNDFTDIEAAITGAGELLVQRVAIPQAPDDEMLLPFLYNDNRDLYFKQESDA